MPEPIEVTTASFHVFAVTTAGPAYVWILPDNDGPDEDNPLAGDTVQVTSDGWVDLDFSDAGLTFEANEKFYVVALHAFESSFSFSMDQTTPLSFRGWEYTGGLAPDRDREVSDVMFKVYADAGTGIDEEIIPKTFYVDQNYPNPFNAMTNINFAIDNESDVRIGIYNVVGQLVNDLSGHFKAGQNSVSWNASDVASGVYFYKISVGDNVETKKMVLLK